MTDTEAAREDLDEAASPRRSSPRRTAVAIGLVVVLAAAGVTIGVLASGNGTPFNKPPTPVLGQSLRPLAVYERVVEPLTPHPKLRAHQRELPPITGINPTVINAKPVISLHVEYARVVPTDGGAWRMAIAASEGTFFNGVSMGHHAYVVIINGKPIPLWPLWEMNGPPITAADATQFLLGNFSQWPSEADALAVARSLTTSVTIANCTAAQIAEYRCS